jgi:hypothetical protein
MDFSDNTTQIILAVVALFAGGSFIAYRVSKKNSNNNNKTINQNRNNVIGGDIVGGNKTTKP